MSDRPEIIKSDRMVLEAPFSYRGSAKRIWPLAQRGDNSAARVAWQTGALVLVASAWCLVTVWYTVTILLLGIVTIPYRIVRRRGRRDRRAEQQHREMLERLGPRR